ncbi:MAG: hypothetical protein Q9163_003744 [Psora crenata]
MAVVNEPFYIRYYSGHSGRFGHEFLEFDFRALGDGRSASARYANNSNYRNDSLIRKEMCVSSLLISEIKRIVKESEIMKEDDSKWPEKNKDGKQELEIRLGNEHISFETAKIGSLVDVTESDDPEGLRVFYYLVQDLKALVFSLISLHFKIEPNTHTSCPPDFNDRNEAWREETLDEIQHVFADIGGGSPSRRRQESSQDGRSVEICNELSHEAMIDDGSCGTPLGNFSPPMAVSPPNSNQEEKEPERNRTTLTASSALDLPYSAKYGIGSMRLIQPHSSCKLRAGSKYRGTQTSDQQRYNVDVDIKSVDMTESFLCGYLKIEGLTPEHATLTTYFEGEIIGPKYTFQTRHDSWGATDKDDMKHWGHFPAWKPLAKQAKKADFHYKNGENRENVFMRWKEKFLVPDHKVKVISGASFEGFYYICFNQIAGAISGIYYHSTSNQ